MSLKKLRIIEAAEAICTDEHFHNLEPAWVYTGYEAFLNETIARCPAAWRSAVTECVLSLNSALPTTDQPAGASRNQCVAQLEFDFSGSFASLQPARESRYNFDGELLPYQNRLRDQVIAGIARRLEVKTRCTCQTCGGRKNPKSPLSRCSSCNSVIRTGARLGKELRNFLHEIRHDANHGHGRNAQGSRVWSNPRTLERLQELLLREHQQGRYR
jgi:hypothetical protein